MAVLPQRIKVAPTTIPARFGLLATVSPQPLPARAALGGVSYDTDFCGVARPWVAPCADPEDLGSISVSVSNIAVATITGTGEPAGTYVVDWGDGNTDTGALDGQTNTYAAPGVYTVTVTGPDGYTATVSVTVVAATASGPFAADAIDTKVPDDGIGITEGSVITIYHLSTCRLISSGGESERRGRAERALTLGASRALEEGFGTVIGADTGISDVSPGGLPTDVRTALALLEQYGGANYGGQRFIHADNAVVTMLISRNLVHARGDHLETTLGSIVISGPGYAASIGPSTPAVGARWMYATGQVNCWMQDIKVTETVLNSNPYDNEYSVLAERLYVPTYECFAAAAEVNLEA